MSLKRVCLLVLAILLASCVTPDVATPAPTQQAVKIIYPVSLQPWADRLSVCAKDHPAIALYFIQQADSASSPQTNEIRIVLGQPSAKPAGVNLFQVGWEHVVVVVNQANPLTKLSMDQLRQVFSGEMTSWKSGPGNEIQVWVLPDADSARHVFDQALALGGLLAPAARLAPDPAALMEAVGQDENAVGYLPQSYINNASTSLSNKLKIVQLEQAIEQDLHQPVIALTQSEPSGPSRELLACLQKSNP